MRRRGRDRYTPAQARAGSGNLLPPFIHAYAEVQISALAEVWDHLTATLPGAGIGFLAPTRTVIAREVRTQLALAMRGSP